MIRRQISSEQLENYLQRGRKRAIDVVAALGQLDKYLDAVSTEVGQELLRDDVEDFERLLGKIAEESATPEEKAEYRVIKRRIQKMASRIDAYNKYAEEVTKS